MLFLCCTIHGLYLSNTTNQNSVRQTITIYFVALFFVYSLTYISILQSDYFLKFSSLDIFTGYRIYWNNNNKKKKSGKIILFATGPEEGEKEGVRGR